MCACVFSPGCLPFIAIDSQAQYTQCLRCASTARANSQLIYRRIVVLVLVVDLFFLHTCSPSAYVSVFLVFFCTGSDRAPNNAIKRMECSRTHVQIVQRSQNSNCDVLQNERKSHKRYQTVNQVNSVILCGKCKYFLSISIWGNKSMDRKSSLPFDFTHSHFSIG